MSKPCKRCGMCCRNSIIEDISELDLIREPRLRAHVTPIKQTPGLDDDEEQQYMLMTPCPFANKIWSIRKYIYECLMVINHLTHQKNNYGK